jgi:DNA-binding transcriptional regulator YhcF (GntR family)
MRFWITKNSEISVRQQLVRQVLLGILSSDLAEGTRLPSLRATARRYRIHANTVSSAYRDLFEAGWLELRRGSGLYVRPLRKESGGNVLETRLRRFLRDAAAAGHSPEQVLLALEGIVTPRRTARLTLFEPEPAMREILVTELSAKLGVPIDVTDLEPLQYDPGTSLLAALPTRALALQRRYPGLECHVLRLPSVASILADEPAPPAHTLIAVLSRSEEIRQGARAMLIAAGVPPDSLFEVDAARATWRESIQAATLVVTDAKVAPEVPAGIPRRVFHVVAESSIKELRQSCRPPL